MLFATAPGVLFDFRITTSLDAAGLFETGEFQLAIGPFVERGQRFSSRPLLQDEFVAVLHEDHDAARIRELSRSRFAAIPQIEITSVPYTTAFIDKALARYSLERHVVVRAPIISTMLLLLDGSDLLCVGRRRAVDMLAPHHPVVIRRLPFPSPVMETVMIWPRRLDDQPSHQWLRAQFCAIAGSLPPA